MPPIYVPSVASINYAPSDVPVNAFRTARLYLPIGPPQQYGYMDGRYPLIIVCNLDGFTVSSPQLSYPTGAVYQSGSGQALFGVDRFLDAGRAVLDITVCRCNFTYQGNGQIGNGLFHSVSAAANRMANPNYPMFWKDGMYAVAYCKKNKDNIDGAGTKIKELPGWYGRSAGTVVGQMTHAYNNVLGLIGSVSTDTMYGFSTNIAFLSGAEIIGVHANWYGDTLTGVPFPNATIGLATNYGTALSANEVVSSQVQLSNASYKAAYTIYGAGTLDAALWEANKVLPWVSAYGGAVTQDSIPGRIDPTNFLTATNFQVKGHGCYGGLVQKYLLPGKVQVFLAQDFSTADLAGSLITRHFLDPRRMYDTLTGLVLDMTKADNGVP